MRDRTDRVFDKRIVERNIKRGKITRKEYLDMLASLPDVEQNAEYLPDGALGEQDHTGDGSDGSANRTPYSTSDY
jgi:hypothetical protein